MIIRVGFIFIVFIYLCIWARFREKLRLFDIITIVFFLLYIYLLLSLTLFSRTEFSDVEVSLVPFYSYYGILTKGWNGEGFYIAQSLIGNVILFMPLGVFFSVLFQEKKNKLFIVGICALAVSLTIEVIQYSFCLGTFEIDDLIHNTLGGIFSSLIAQSVVQFDLHSKGSISKVSKKLMPLIVFTVIFSAVCMISIVKLWITLK